MCDGKQKCDDYKVDAVVCAPVGIAQPSAISPATYPKTAREPNPQAVITL